MKYDSLGARSPRDISNKRYHFHVLVVQTIPGVLTLNESFTIYYYIEIKTKKSVSSLGKGLLEISYSTSVLLHHEQRRHEIIVDIVICLT